MWAFGCVLYEMLTGRRAFDGERTQEVIARVIEREPDFELLPKETPPALRRLLRRLLTKNARKRLADISDARIELEEAAAELAQGATTQPAAPRRRFSLTAAALLSAASATVITGVVYQRRVPSEVTPQVRFTLTPPAGVTWAVPTADTVLAVSPDGRSLAVTGRGSDGKTSLWLRSLDSLELRLLPGTDGAISPFWSPDSQSIGFFADGKLKRIDASGGAVTILCDAVNNRGGTWGSDRVIVFARVTGPLQKVSESGGIPSPATVLVEKEIYHSRPILLPGSRRFIFRVDDPSLRGNRYYVSSLDSTDRTLIVRLDSGNLAYSQGHLLFVVDESTLMAQPFDVERLTLSGEPIPIVENIRMSAGNRPLFGVFSVSQTGVLGYLTGSGRLASRVVWLDRSGKEVDILAETGDYLDVSLSHDGARAAVTQYDEAANSGDVWLFDVRRRLSTRLTPDPVDDGGHEAFCDVGPCARLRHLLRRFADQSVGSERREVHGHPAAGQ